MSYILRNNNNYYNDNPHVYKIVLQDFILGKHLYKESNKRYMYGLKRGVRLIRNRTSQVILCLNSGAWRCPYFQKTEFTLCFLNVQSSSFDSQVHA